MSIQNRKSKTGGQVDGFSERVILTFFCAAEEDPDFAKCTVNPQAVFLKHLLCLFCAVSRMPQNMESVREEP